MPRKSHGFSVLKLQIALGMVFVGLVGGGGWWYFTHYRKPQIAQSLPPPLPSAPAPQPQAVPVKVPPVTADKAPLMTPFVVPAAQSAVAPPAPVPAAAPAEAETITLRKLPELSPGERPDLLLAKRTERRFAKLKEWSARLNAKKATLKTPLQIEAFNEEAGKYHAELAEARAEASAP